MSGQNLSLYPPTYHSRLTFTILKSHPLPIVVFGLEIIELRKKIDFLLYLILLKQIEKKIKYNYS